MSDTVQDTNSFVLSDPELFTELQRLASARMMVLPEDTQMSIGAIEYSRDDIVQHIKDGDDLGKQIMNMQLEYLQDLAGGELYKDE